MLLKYARLNNIFYFFRKQRGKTTLNVKRYDRAHQRLFLYGVTLQARAQLSLQYSNIATSSYLIVNVPIYREQHPREEQQR